jgi:hypothetical protein
MNDMETHNAEAHGTGGEKGMCAECAAKVESAHAEQFVYAIGELDARFPTVGIEREFQQRERALELKEPLPAGRGERLKITLDANPHLWSRICFVMSVGNMPAYIVVPSSQHALRTMLGAVSRSSDRDAFVALVGRRAGSAGPAQCGDLLAPIVVCDLLYPFRVEEWIDNLGARVEHALKARKTETARFKTVAREFFSQVVRSTENIGGLDTHRALNYALVQHPGLALSVAERPQSVLDRIETRQVQGTDLRRVIAIILTFVDRASGVPERLFCRVDVTEEWPFLMEGPSTSVPSLGLMPYVDHAMLGTGF